MLTSGRPHQRTPQWAAAFGTATALVEADQEPPTRAGVVRTSLTPAKEIQLDLPLRGKLYHELAMSAGLRIGELARRAGVTPKAIRFYETKRILPLAPRSSNRYRVYGEDTVGMLSFIKQATGLGLTLAEIKEIIGIREGGRPPCGHVHQLLEDKAVELDRKLNDLLEVRRRIRRSLTAWKTSRPARAVVCAHIEAQPTSPRAKTSAKARRKP